MPSNRGHGHHPPRWYKLCFSDNSADSSDDSDTDPVFQSRISSAPSVSLEEPPDSASDPDNENDWRHFSPSSPQLPAYPLPPPPPPPLVFPPPPPPPSFDIQSPQAAYEAVSSSSSYAPRSLVDRLCRVPDEVAGTIRLMDILGVRLRDELSHCPICMEDFEVGDTVCMLPCNHAYRLVCILRWLETSATCPVCRLELAEGSHRRAVENRSRVPPPFWDIGMHFDFFAGLEPEEVSSARDHNWEEAEHYDSARDEIDDDGDEGGAG